MKKLFIIIFAALSSLPSYGQDNLNTKWILSIDFGIQEHDKRLFDYPQKESLLEMQPENFGTYQFGVSLIRQIIFKKKFEVFAGIGLSSELSTFTRPINHNFRRGGGTLKLWTTDRYYQNLIQLTLEPRYRITESLSLSLDVMPQFNFLSIADNKVKSFSWWRFDFYSVEVNPGIEYTTSKFVFGLKYRVFQIKKIDKILFNSIIRDPRKDQTFETENPFKLWLSIGYKF